MSLRKPIFGARLWMTAQILFTIGLIGGLVTASIISEIQQGNAEWNRVILGGLSCSMFLGAIILWLFAWKFYVRTLPRLGIYRGALYLVIVIAFSILAPLILIVLEGKDAFFEEAFR